MSVLGSKHCFLTPQQQERTWHRQVPRSSQAQLDRRVRVDIRKIPGRRLSE